MTEPTLRDLAFPDGFRSPFAATFVAHLNDQSRRLALEVGGLAPDDFTWQPAPGLNTMGMLLAHMPIVEVFWTDLVLRDRPDAMERVHEVLGIGGDDDGIPLAPGATPPAGLNGRSWSWYADLHDRARRHLVEHARGLTDADLERRIERRRGDQTFQITPRWMLYHVAEHFSGHYGQVLMLRHMRQAMVPSGR